jgi:hypothetical protein
MLLTGTIRMLRSLMCYALSSSSSHHQTLSAVAFRESSQLYGLHGRAGPFCVDLIFVRCGQAEYHSGAILERADPLKLHPFLVCRAFMLNEIRIRQAEI